MDKPKKRILLIQTAFIGDVILITPLIRAIKKVFPDSELDVLLTPATQDILLNNPNIHEILVFDKRNHKSTAFWKTLRALREKRYDIAISPHSSLTSAHLMYLSGIPERIGFDRGMARIYLTNKVPHLKNILKIQKNLHLMKVFTNEEFSIQTELFPSKEMDAKATALLSDLRKNGRGKIIAMAPGSIWQTKCWLEEYYAKLANLFVESGFPIVLIGGKEDYSLCERILPHHSVINLAGRTSILESAAVLKQCKLLVCNDSGAMHIANAVKTDVYAFFGPTVREFGYFPFRPNDHVFEVDLSCRPCGSHGGKKCPLGHHNCMKLITPEIVFNYFKEHSMDN
jgi:heptosyltransferase-2